MKEKERTCSPQEITSRLATLPGWTCDDGALVRTYETNGWGTTLMVVNAIGFLCEAAGHHPDLAVSWSSVGVRLWTHSAGGITDKDFEAATLIEKTALWKPDAGSALGGPPKEIIRGSEPKQPS
jgi:4a-hydroxytetrahydrobiopterin dehydratase